MVRNMKTKVRVFHPDASDPSLSGLLRYHYLAKYLVSDGYDFTIFTSSRFRHSKINLIDDNLDVDYIEKEFEEIKYIYLKTTSYEKNDINRIKNWLSYYISATKTGSSFIKEQIKPDIIIGSSPHPLSMLATVRLGKKFGIPIINEVRDFWPEVFFLNGRVKEKSLLGRVLLRGERFIYDKSDKLIFLKEGDYKYVIDRKWDESHGGKINIKDIHYINNGVDLDEYNNRLSLLYRDFDLESSKFKLIYTGGLRMVNNIDNILDTAKILSIHDDIIFLIYGDGDYRETLEKRIIDEKITNVKIKGYVDNKYIPYILSKASVNLLNYSDKYKWDRGNSSNKIFEYMASGKPIISTVKMGYSFIDRYKIGIELEKNEPNNLAEAILKLKNIDNEKYDEMCNNAKLASKDFDYKKLSGKLKNVIGELTEEEQ